MSISSVFWNIVNFFGLPFFMAIFLPLATLPWQRCKRLLALLQQSLLLFVLASLTLLVGLFLLRVDGKLMVYCILIVLCASIQTIFIYRSK
jgi:hypothetical protein